jgi:propionate CoA-transferase
MRIRSADQIERIKAAVDTLLEPVGHKVNSVVNYDRFDVADDLLEVYADAVRYVEQTYYLKVARYTTSGFMRLKLGKEFRERSLASELYGSADEAAHHVSKSGTE